MNEINTYNQYCALTYKSLFLLFTEIGLFDTIEAGKEDSVHFFNTWVQYVKEKVPSDRLLVFEVKQGWKPLCDFLELPIPNEKFPNVNDSASMIRKFKMLRIVSTLAIYFIPLLMAIFITYLFF